MGRLKYRPVPLKQTFIGVTVNTIRANTNLRVNPGSGLEVRVRVNARSRLG